MKKGSSFIVFVLFLLGLLIFIISKLTSGNGEGIGLFSLVQPPWYEASSSSEVVVNPPSASQGTSAPSTPTPPQEVNKPIPPQGIPDSELSPYYKKVNLSSVRAPSGYWEKDFNFTVRADQSLAKPVSVSGWTITTNRGKAVAIPQGVSDYTGDAYNAVGNIVLAPGGYVTVYGGRSPINWNIRLNKCTGYLNQSYKISPALPNECPRIDDPRVVTFSGRCQNYIRSLGTCEIPEPAELNEIASANDSACRTLLDTQNYLSCRSMHHWDANFFSGEWRAWIDQYVPFDFYHDRLFLRDEKNLLVSEYIY